MDILLLIGLLFLFLSISVPIGISLGLSTLITMVVSGSVPTILIAQSTFTGIDSFPLLAIPFFMLAGTLMSYGGISKRIVNFAESLIGWVTGGLAMVTVLACMFFAAVSGSGPATVTAIGSFMIPSMREKKYDGSFATALTAAAGSIGVVIPPSIPFVIYCVVSDQSVLELFVAGIVPGIVIGLALMAISYFTAKKNHYPHVERNYGFKDVAVSFKNAFWALLVPVIILGGIYGGLFTPTEAAVVGVVYALFVGKFIYKELDAKTIRAAFMDALVVNGATNFMLGLSAAFATYLTMEEVPVRIGEWILTISSKPWVILLLVDMLLLAVGCFIDNISSMIILTPIFLPVMRQIGIDPIHFGLFMTVALAIGFITPPYGANLFVASAVSGEKMSSLSRSIMPFVAVMVLCLLLFTYVPSVSMALVHMLRG